MTTLNELVILINQFDSAPQISEIKLTANLELLKIINLTNENVIVSEEDKNNLLAAHNQLQQAFENIDSVIEQIKKQIKKNIAQSEMSFYDQSFRIYKRLQLDHQKYRYGKADNDLTYTNHNGFLSTTTIEDRNKFEQEINTLILNQHLEISESVKNSINLRIIGHVSWQYPAAIIRPNANFFIDAMVASDPLYLIEEHSDLLTSTLTQFNQLYQNRLRSYIINESSQQNILNQLPSNQFSFFLVYNYFNYKPFNVVKQYLVEIFEKLRPGGVVAFTFNNCDKISGVLLASQRVASYTPRHEILNMSKTIGYKQIFECDDSGPSHWLELQKPGSHTGIRGGQTLAKINHK